MNTVFLTIFLGYFTTTVKADFYSYFQMLAKVDKIRGYTTLQPHFCPLRPEKHIFKVNTDPRRWAAGSTTEVGTEISLPKNLTAGEYNVYLNLPDPYKSLSTRPEYSIRLANKEVWEPQTGYNKIHTIKIKN